MIIVLGLTAAIISGCGISAKGKQETEQKRISDSNTSEETSIAMEETKVDIGMADIEYKQDDTSPLWDIKNEMDDRALGTEQMPDSLTLNDITAYYAYSGYASENVNYIVNNDNGYFMVYRLDCEFGEQDMQTGIVKNNDELLKIFSSLSYKKVEGPELDGESISYGILYYEKDGELLSCYTSNIFE